MAEITNEIDLLALDYLDSLDRDVREEFVLWVRSGWQLSKLEAFLSSYHARWLGAREVIRG